MRPNTTLERARIAAFASLSLITSQALATPPLKEVVVTPDNEGQFEFSVVLSGKGEDREFIVYAPPYTHGDCVPTLGGTELRSREARLVYSQTIDLGTRKEGTEIRGQIRVPTNVLKLWINFLCPGRHSQDGARYIFSSADWEKSGRLR